MKMTRCLFAAAVLVAAAPAFAAASPAEVMEHHRAAAARSDVDALIADYADDAVVLQAGKAVQGKPAIRALFERMFPKPAPGAAPAGAAAMTVKRSWSEGDVGFYEWQIGPRAGTDEFLVRDGKIKVQAVFFAAPTP